MNKNFFKNKSLLITGGTGSFGKSLVKFLLKNKFPLKRIVIFSRDELKQFEMNKVYNVEQFSSLRYFIGDVRDKDRLKSALRNIDFVVHAAALKQVPAAEYNPIEYIKTNVYGAQNIIESCLDSGVTKVVALSTDKASSPINLYGATKLCSDKLFVSANNIKGNKDIIFSVVRYGNVFGSRGSVVDSFLEQKKKKVIYITDKKMTRFNINLEQCISLVLDVFQNAKGGEIFVPKIPSFNVMDLARAVCDKSKIIFTGIRPGEKLHEEMISAYDSINTIDMKNYYVIVQDKNLLKNYKRGKKITQEFIYRSDLNKNFLTIKELSFLIKEYLQTK
jgi:UDP-N-acetylglucosamine 4,6-dehydratase (inverting)